MSKKRIANYVFLPGVSSSSNAFPDAYSLLSANIDFIKNEASAFIAEQIIIDSVSNLYPKAVTLLTNNRQFILDEISAWTTAQVASANATSVFLGYTYGATEIARCKSEAGRIVDALISDVRYGGNEKIINVASQYYLSGVTQVINTPVELAIQTRLWNIITGFVLQAFLLTPTSQSPVTSTQSIAGGAAEAAAITQLIGVSNLISNVVTGGLSTLPPVVYSAFNFPGYTYDLVKCKRDIGYVLNAYAHDLRYGGNIQTRLMSSRYWDGEIPYVDGDRKPEIATHTFIRNLINTVIFFPATAYTELQNSEPRQLLTGTPGEAGALARITALANVITTVIANGLGSLPTRTGGPTSIKLQGKYSLDTLLLITNSTNNQIIYNFSDPLLGATSNFNASLLTSGNDRDEDFPSFLNTTDGVTTLELLADTSGCLTTDDIQIFVESPVQITRPNDFGTDAIERLRVAQPQSMLDADFEYGLQPTKWQAIGVARGYPSVYEVPGTDTPVVSVVTDASAGTGGIGESLLTVTTQGAHGFSAGTPITIRSLANTITGFSRAEGTFIVISVPTTTTFTYYATSKVGSTPGQVLATTYTQLRKGAFYTGAAVGQPAISVFSNGTSSSFTTKFITIPGSDQIAVSGALPTLGVPLVGTGINPGTQITGTVGVGGVITANVSIPVVIGDTAITLVNSTGVLEGMAINNGTGTAVFVNGVTGNIVSFTQPLTAAKGGAAQSYLNKSGTNITPPGTGAVFSVDRVAGNYANITPTTAGTNYVTNSRIKIAGTDLGGISPANDLTLKIASVTNLDTFNNVAQSTTSGTGTSAVFNIITSPTGVYSASIQAGGSGYLVNDTVKILGTSLGGATTANDATVTVTTVTRTYTSVVQTASSGLGSGALFTVIRTGALYALSVTTPGINYTPGDTITVAGTSLGGATPANDLTFTVADVDINNGINLFNTQLGTGTGPGTIISASVTGTGIFVGGLINTVTTVSGISISGERAYPGLVQDTTNGSGSGAVFDVATASGIYDVMLMAPGITYGFGEILTIVGTQLGGTSPANDLTLTVTSSSAFGGGLLSFNTSGTPSSVDEVYTGLSVAKITTGANASFDISRAGGAYTTAVVNLGGTGYEVNDKILLSGANFDGINPTNNVTITVTGVDTPNGDITTATVAGTAVSGAGVDFYSAVSLSEVTTASILDATVISTAAIATLQLTFASAHGLVPGATLLVDITSTGTNHALAKGPFYVEAVPSHETVRYTARTTGVIDTGVNLVGTVYSRPDSYFIHRPFDGGVQLGTGGPQHGAQAIRMSKKYIRYQSGKGIMYTTGALFAPSYNLQAISSTGVTVGSYITVTTDDVDHGCQVGGVVKIIGVDTAGYNGTYTVTDVITERQFKVQAQTTLSSVYGSITTAAQMSILYWHGSTVRAGTFDDQNGMFWQYDGRELSVGRRSSTLQLSGVITIAKDSNVVTGSNTRFRDQVKAGDRVVIRGMTQVVSNVFSQTSMTVTPDYRGASNAVNAKVCLVQDLIIKQKDFNLDRLDGTGPSGYDLDITKMQMIGMQWSWYGAGFIDFMLRGADGNYVFAHRIRNSNTNTEAYMRTGNMPVRYEVINEGSMGKLRTSVSALGTTLQLFDAETFPNESGVVYVDNELISFTGKSGNTLVNCVRSAPMINFVGGAQRSFRAGPATSHEVNTGVILISNTISPIISHWGSAMLTDGRFDEDRGYLFNYASTGIGVSTTKQTAFLIRLAPSVSNAIIGDLGDRELINRAQLLLKAIEVTSDAGSGGLVVEGILNPQNYPVDPTAISWSGLAGSSAGGQPSFAQVAPGGSVSWAGGAATTTSTATTTTALTGNATVPNNALFASGIGSNLLYVTKASWDTLGASAGFSVATSETKYPAGTTVSSVSPNPAPIATTLGVITGTITVPNNAVFAQGGPAQCSQTYIFGTTLYINVAPTYGYFSSNMIITGTNVQAGTRILNQINGTLGGQGQYTVSINQTPAGQPFVGTSTGSNIIYASQVSWTALNGDVGTAVFGSSDFTAGTTVTGVTGPAINQGVSYYTLTMSTNALTAHLGNSTVPFFVTGAANSTGTSLNFTQSSWLGLPLGANAVSNTVNDTAKFSNGTAISAVSAVKTFASVNYYTVTFNSGLVASQAAGVNVTFNFTAYYSVLLSRNATSAINANATVAFTPAVIATNTSFLYFTQASWETLVGSYGAGTGTEVVDPTKFPSGTKVASIFALTSFGGTAYYRVNFTQSSIVAVPPTTTITFQFGLPPYAQPGETVFSFIAAPGTTSNLDLSDLKELTNTTLGGRGTYPNGPDVLAINVYRASGAGSIPTNIIVRWGEAQA